MYLFMLAVPRNDDEHVHDGLREPGHMKTRLARRRRSRRTRCHVSSGWLSSWSGRCPW
jgi:hypothetical protein